jgi:hypothetical protein
MHLKWKDDDDNDNERKCDFPFEKTNKNIKKKQKRENQTIKWTPSLIAFVNFSIFEKTSSPSHHLYSGLFLREFNFTMSTTKQ